ncbi:MAG: BTAD domain-containing putative transcriptional regulator [Streptosporangiaceae bacterium]
MRFGILGSVEVWDGAGNSIAVGGPRVRSLLALLLVNAGKVVSAETLIDGLYGEDPPANAANALQSQVSRLRRGLDGAAEVELLPAGYRLAVDPDEVDAHRFVRLVQEAGREPARRAGALKEALALWRGPALADVPEAEAQAVRYAELRVSAIEDLAETELALGRHRETVAELQSLVDAHPLRERPRALLMRALYGSGRQAEALEAYAEGRRLLAEELGADPSAELAAVHLAILRAEPEPTATVPKQLPAQLTSFIGRTEELRRIDILLQAGRLVTLLGPGGAGKTRLSVEAGERAEFEVCFVDLAPLGVGSEVPQALMSALGLRESSVLPSGPGQHQDPQERLISALGARPLLLILDNCEHVIADAARLVHRLLGSCPTLRILATSREPLSITGEAICPVGQLGLPAAGADLPEASGSPAVRLFADRAGAVRPDFEVTAANIQQIVRICSALDGQPLAIELAAARLRTLSVDDVAGRLDDRFRLLSRGGDRTKAPRHQTLRAVVEWSWDLLNADEQELARRLTVFAGGATLAAAERVCAVEDVDGLLADLTDKSLVQRLDGRFRMLDTIRVFCAEQLGEQEEELHRAHAVYFLELATAADPHLRSAGQLTWLDLLAAEHGNLQSALRWSVRTDPVLALRLLAAVSPYWWLRGLRTEVTPMAAELLARIGTTPPEGLAEEYVLCVANAATGALEQPELAVHLARADAILDSIQRPLRQPFTHAIWALAAGPPKDHAQAMKLRGKQFEGDPWAESLFLVGSGFLHLFAGETNEAEADLTRALRGFRAIGDRWGTTQTLDALAALAEQRGDHDTASSLLGEALELVEELGSVEDTADLVCRRGDGLLASDPAAAQADYERAAKLAAKAGSPSRLAAAHRGLGEVARLAGDLRQARILHEIALEELDANWFMGDVRALTLLGLGRINLAQHRLAEARGRCVGALSAALCFPRNPVLGAEAIECLAGTEPDSTQAAVLRGAAAALRGPQLAGDPEPSEPYARGAALTIADILTLTGAEVPIP